MPKPNALPTAASGLPPMVLLVQGRGRGCYLLAPRSLPLPPLPPLPALPETEGRKCSHDPRYHAVSNSWPDVGRSRPASDDTTLPSGFPPPAPATTPLAPISRPPVRPGAPARWPVARQSRRRDVLVVPSDAPAAPADTPVGDSFRGADKVTGRGGGLFLAVSQLNEVCERPARLNQCHFIGNLANAGAGVCCTRAASVREGEGS